MTKGERLIWDLFTKFRELLFKVEPTADNSKWATEWAAVFHEMGHPTQSVEPEHLAQPSANDHADDDVPHVRSAPKRTKK